MSASSPANRRIVLAARPKGRATVENFRLESTSLPKPGDGEVLLRTLWLSLDPYMRGRMDEARSYAQPVAVGGVMTAQVVARVEMSRDPAFAPGDLALAGSGWQDYAALPASQITRVDPRLERPSFALGVLGMPGLTAYVGLLDIGQPEAGETVVVSAATGAVGSVAGQIAKLKDCRVVGVAGGREKCAYAVEELGFDACVDHRGPELNDQLARACPKGIDVYFENVGGATFEAVRRLLNDHARVPLCGLISLYDASELPPGPDRTGLLMRDILVKRLRVQGFIVSDHFATRRADFLRDMQTWVASGAVRVREDVVDGLERAPEAFLGLLAGRNFGKLVVKVA